MSDYEPKSKKRSFVLYYNNVETVLKMLRTNEERGELFTDLCNYEMYGEEPLEFSSPQIQAVFYLISSTLRENKERWVLQCKQNSINRTSGTNRTNRTNGTYKDNEKDIDKDNEKEKDKEQIITSSDISSIIHNMF